VLVWFHGGGLTEGDKTAEETLRAAKALASRGVIVAAANYRLSPQVCYPEYIRDAAAAVAWVRKHAADYGGDAKRCFVGGHSAGGYLAWMLGLDPTWLAQLGLSTDDVAGLIPVSGQAIVHTAIRDERGVPLSQIVVDDAAPLYHASNTPLPILCICATDDIALRCQENALLCAALTHAGCPSVTSLTIDDHDHTTIIWNMPDDNDPVTAAIVDFIGG
jgi:acetyl esterase/lipase